MSEKKLYSYASTIKSDSSDELINTYVIRPVAGILVRILYPTPFSPNHVTIASGLAGFLAAYLYLDGTAATTMTAGLCITAKDILDSTDGQLARAKNQFSRAGRFLDSIVDFFVNVFVFAAIAIALFITSHSSNAFVLGFLAFAGMALRVSYHVFYQTSYLHLDNAYNVNRITEEIRDEDAGQKRFTLMLQRLFQILYGWQDRFMVTLDAWCRGVINRSKNSDALWYGDRFGLRISGLIGLGTELFLLMLFSVANELEAYLYVNLIVMNGVWLAAVLYRKRVLSKRIRNEHQPAHAEDSL